MTDLSGIWVCGKRVYLFTQVNDKFTWKLLKEKGEETGIGWFTGLDTIEAVWNCPGDVGRFEQGKGRIKIENGREVQDWGDREILKRP